MFELQKLLSSSRRNGLALETKKRSPIKNHIALPPTDRDIRIDTLIKTKYGNKWEQRKPPCGGYNCAGMVWASRRTEIAEQEEWYKILKEDNYRLLNDDEDPMPGDIVLYFDEEHSLHVGLVVRMDSLLNSSGTSITTTKIPWILSKWSATAGEYLHHFEHVGHLNDKFPNLKKQFWTDRP